MTTTTWKMETAVQGSWRRYLETTSRSGRRSTATAGTSRAARGTPRTWPGRAGAGVRDAGAHERPGAGRVPGLVVPRRLEPLDRREATASGAPGRGSRSPPPLSRSHARRARRRGRCSSPCHHKSGRRSFSRTSSSSRSRRSPSTLGTTVGAVKTALHRGRGQARRRSGPRGGDGARARGARCVLCRVQRGDIDRLTALLLDSGGRRRRGGDHAVRPRGRTPDGAVRDALRLGRLADPEGARLLRPHFADGALPDAPPRVEARLHRGRWLLLHWYKHVDGEAVRAITTLELDGRSRGAVGELLLQRGLSRRRRRRAERSRSRERPSLVGSGGAVMRPAMRGRDCGARSRRWPRCRRPRRRRRQDTTAPNTPSGQGRLVAVNGLQMYVEEHGSGPPLLLLHGGGSTAQSSFGAIIPMLARTHHVIAPEQQAHGHSGDGRAAVVRADGRRHGGAARASRGRAGGRARLLERRGGRDAARDPAPAARAAPDPLLVVLRARPRCRPSSGRGSRTRRWPTCRRRCAPRSPRQRPRPADVPVRFAKQVALMAVVPRHPGGVAARDRGEVAGHRSAITT